jgi:hypothetical protein
MMDMNHLESKDPIWAKAIREGSLTTVLKAEIRDHPGLMNIIIRADNVKHGANLTEHSLQLLKRMHDICKSMPAASHWSGGHSTILSQPASGQTEPNETHEVVALREFVGSLGVERIPFAKPLYDLALRLGNGDSMEELGDFTQLYDMGGREMEFQWLEKLAQVPLDMPRVRIALVKCHLTCHTDKMVGIVCRFISIGDLDSILKRGKKLYDKAQECEAFLVKFRSTYQPVLDVLQAMSRTDILTRLDSNAARVLLGKTSFMLDVSDVHTEFIIVGHSEHLQIAKALEKAKVQAHTTGAAAIEVDMPKCLYVVPPPASGQAKGKNKPASGQAKSASGQAKAGAGMVQYTAGGGAQLEFILKDEGFLVDGHVRLDDISHHLLQKVKQGSIARLVCLDFEGGTASLQVVGGDAVIVIPISLLRSVCVNCDAPQDDKNAIVIYKVSSANRDRDAIARNTLRRCELTLAMAQVRAQFEADLEVDVRAGGVTAKTTLKKGTTFPLVSFDLKVMPKVDLVSAAFHCSRHPEEESSAITVQYTTVQYTLQYSAVQ